MFVTATCLWVMHHYSFFLPALFVDNFRSPLQELSNGPVSLHQQRHGVTERAVPHYGEWLCRFSRMLHLRQKCVSSMSPVLSIIQCTSIHFPWVESECRSHLCPVDGWNMKPCCSVVEETLEGVPGLTFSHFKVSTLNGGLNMFYY